MYLSFTLKIALSNFLSLRKKLFSIRGLAFSYLLSCTKHSISVLRSSKLVILCIEALTWLALQKSSNTWKSVFCIANNISFHEKKSFMYLSFTLKIAFSNFLSLRKKLFSIRGCILFICLVALNTALVFLEALNYDSVHWSSNMTCSAKKL